MFAAKEALFWVSSLWQTLCRTEAKKKLKKNNLVFGATSLQTYGKKQALKQAWFHGFKKQILYKVLQSEGQNCSWSVQAQEAA